MCLTSLTAPDPLLRRAIFWGVLGLLGGLALLSHERYLVVVSFLLALCLVALYSLRTRLFSPFVAVWLLFVWILFYPSREFYGTVVLLALVGTPLSVYTMCTRIPPHYVMLTVLLLSTMIYAGALTVFAFLYLGPQGFCTYLSIVVLVWNAWVHDVRLANR